MSEAKLMVGSDDYTPLNIVIQKLKIITIRKVTDDKTQGAHCYLCILSCS